MPVKKPTKPDKNLDFDQVVGPGEIPVDPDADTNKNPAYTDGGAPNQVLHFQWAGISYGTDDKGHAAALILSVLLLLLLVLLFIIGAIVDRAWISDALKILVPALTFVAGVAIGQNKPK